MILQRKVIRAISWSERNAHTPPLFFRYGLSRVAEFNEYHNACTMFQVVNDLNPRLSELVPIYYPNHSYSTRNSDHIHGKDRMLECTRLSVVYRGPQIWNNLDNSLKDMKSFSSFKKNLKRLLISHYETE